MTQSLTKRMPRNRRTKPSLVVVGNGMVSYKLCEALIQRGGHRRFRIVVLGDEPRCAYDRVHLTQYLKTRDAESLELAPRSWYAEHRIALHTGRRVTRIDRENRCVVLDDDTTVHYDKLVLATGSRPYVPPIDGTDLPGVFIYRTIDDLDAIGAYAKQHGKKAAVIGGGLLGLEAAQALGELGQQVHVIERANWLMPQQLDEDSAAVLEQHVRQLGLFIHLGKTTTRIERVDDSLRLHMATGQHVDVDLVVISAGIRARHELALEAGLDCDTGVAGVIVDDELRTSDLNIYALGECASHRGRVYGLVAPGYEMAEITAKNLAKRFGRRQTFTGGDLSTRLKLLGVEMAVYGDYRGEDGAHVWSAPGIPGTPGTSGAPGKRRHLRIRGDRIVGAAVVGEWSEMGQLRIAIDRQRKITPKLLNHFMATGELWGASGAGHVMRLPDRAVVCNCKHVTAGAMRVQISAGCGTIERLAQCTGASTVCGSCKPMLAELLGADFAPRGSSGVSGWRLFAGVSLTALCVVMTTALVAPIPFADTVQVVMHTIDKLWRDHLYKQISGFSLLGISVVALMLSARKRIKRLSFGSFGWWRVVHGLIGLSSLAVLIAHTGFRMGHNLNFYLMAAFLGLNLFGAAAGFITAMESAGDGDGRVAGFARQWRPWLTWGHILLFWPLPALIGFHIASVYFF
jgi:nitrite reductase (NADH) large subunit